MGGNGGAVVGVCYSVSVSVRRLELEVELGAGSDCLSAVVP